MKTRYRNTAFLVEVLVNILVFSLCCAVLVSAFVQASILVRQTKADNQATAEVYALLETVKLRGEEGLEHAQVGKDGILMLEYGGDWMPAQGRGVQYRVYMKLDGEVRQSGTLYRIEAWAQDENERQMCYFETAVYHPADMRGAA